MFNWTESDNQLTNKTLNINKIRWNKTKEPAAWKMVLNKIWCKWTADDSSRIFKVFCIHRLQVLSAKTIKEVKEILYLSVEMESMVAPTLSTTTIWLSLDKTLKSQLKALNLGMVDWMIISITTPLFIINKLYCRILITL